MVFLPGLAVLFAGIVGGDLGKLEKQIESLVHDVHLKRAPLPVAQLRLLTHHGEGTRDIVKRLHVDGVVGFELVTGHGTPTLRVVIYDGDGTLKTYSELPLGARGLDKDDLDALRSNVADDVSELTHTTPPAPAPSNDSDEIEIDPAPKLVLAPTPLPHKPAAKLGALAEPSFVTPAESEQPHPAAPTTVADASDSVSADEIEAMTGGGNAPVDGGEAHAATSNELRLRAAIGLGVASRGFTPSPSTVPAYTSSPVGAIHLDAAVQPTSRTTVGVVAETTLAMTTPLHSGVAATTIARWEATTSYSVIHDIVDLAPVVGIGRRSFSIDSSDPTRSPDGDYNYLILGTAVSRAVSSRVSMHGLVALEPVVSGTDPTEMTFGSASRWALDVGAAVEVRPLAHVFMRAAADYQRFTCSWNSAGARAAGGAVDSYPSGTLSLGAEY